MRDEGTISGVLRILPFASQETGAGFAEPCRMVMFDGIPYNIFGRIGTGSSRSARESMQHMRLTPIDEWRALLSSRQNVLLQGSTDQAIDQLIMLLTPHLGPPIQTSPHWPPDPMPIEGALILRGVEILHANQQRDLLSWMDNAGAEVQVVAVASTPLYPLVAEGRFLDRLYYRLNALFITADDVS